PYAPSPTAFRPRRPSGSGSCSTRTSQLDLDRPRGAHDDMADLLVVGSVALDSVETPFGKVQEALGASATFFSYSASFFTQVRLVAVVGQDFPETHLRLLEDRGVDIGGL